ncbi:MAG TPA: nucleoside-diphosphate sugar epimerase/dehydratase, partial [Vicinamibacteria bacterium]|nr:nucleoside-diphosphate sugar epimerase/dehydratase [Vicinamibacteria bacterium]
IDWMLTIGLVAGSRVAWRLVREGVLGLSRSSRAALKRVLIAGAGHAGVALAKDLLANRRREVEVIGFVDDDPDKQGSTLLGLPILGTTRDLAEIPRCRPVDQVIVAIPSAPPRVLTRIAEQAGTVVPDVRIVPPLEALLRGKEAVVASRPVPEASFLSRGPVDLGAAGLGRFLEGKSVLVTGAGGSIGSELARQLARHGAAGLRKLVLLDYAETPLYDVHRQTAETLGERALPVLASVRDLHRLAALLASEKPDVVLHAAALKHVPMCEGHPLEALATNTWATCRLADLARDHAVRNFTLVSTDKAVAPACVMGATKRAAETYIRSLAPGSATRFAAVRFGNVLGSNGSLLPLFHEQIRKGGPVTVTDPRATRFFMTIPEACGLILRATRVAQGGEVYVLDMGEPVRILDIAHSLIRRYGYEPGRDIEVRIIGLRPGEKLHETLVDEAEEAEPLGQARLLRLRSRCPEAERCRDLLAALEHRLFERNEEEALRVLRAFVPTFKPQARPEAVPALAEAQAVAS